MQAMALRSSKEHFLDSSDLCAIDQSAISGPRRALRGWQELLKKPEAQLNSYISSHDLLTVLTSFSSKKEKGWFGNFKPFGSNGAI